MYNNVMKIIHCADIHLGSKMDARLSRDKAEERRREIRTTFLKLIDYAQKESVKAIILAGDVFDGDRPFKKDKLFFYDAVKNNPDIDFFYLRGNHDGLENYTLEADNLKTFGEEWTTYGYEDITISGIELKAGNCNSLYSGLSLDKDKINIVVMHGSQSDANGIDKINISRLADKHIDYLALGHYHTHDGFHDLRERGKWAYSGCLEGRGFDETGEKGFILLDVSDGVKADFVPFASRIVREFTVDITGAEDFYAAEKKILDETKTDAKNYVRVYIAGETTVDADDLAKDAEKELEERYFAASVVNRAKEKADISEVAKEKSLKGEFVRLCLEEEMSEEDREKVLAFGLKALDGEWREQL